MSGVDVITATDDAEIPPLLPALPQGGMSAEQQATARELALGTLVALRDRGSVPGAPPSRDELLRIVEHVVGRAEMDDYLPLLEEELALRGDDRRGPTWRKADLDAGRVAQNWPFTLLEYWQRTLAPDPDDYVVA
jgi:hypothetical protein